MNLSFKGRRATALLPVLATALLLIVKVSAQEAKPAATQPPDTSNQPATYVGSQTCQPCHEDIYNAFQKSPHSVVEGEKKRGWDGKACESCHGAASKHAESGDATLIRNPGKLASAQADRICMSCHLNTPTQISRPRSAHAK